MFKKDLIKIYNIDPSKIEVNIGIPELKVDNSKKKH